MQEYCCQIKSAETPRPASTSHAYSQSHSLWMAELPDIFIDISNGRVTWHFSRYKSLTYIYNWFTNYAVFIYTIYRIYRTLFISINLSPANLSFFYRTIKPAKRIECRPYSYLCNVAWNFRWRNLNGLFDGTYVLHTAVLVLFSPLTTFIYVHICIYRYLVGAMSLLMGIGDCALLAFGENNGCCFVALLDMW